jgi:hypothetical protein
MKTTIRHCFSIRWFASKVRIGQQIDALLTLVMYLLRPTATGDGMLDFLCNQTATEARLDERLEQAAQSLTALLKCSSCSVYASENDELILEILVGGSEWAN